MNIFLDLREYSIYNWLVLVGSGLFGAFTWNLHFIVEFSVLINSNASSFIFIIFHLFFISLGSLAYLFFGKKINSFLVYLASTATLSLSMIVMLFVNNIWVISTLLGLAGFSIGIALVAAHYNLMYFFDKPQTSAKLYSVALMSIAPFMIIESFIDKFIGDKKWVNTIFFALILVLIFTSILIGKNNFPLFPQKDDKGRFWSRGFKYSWSGHFALFWGFFFTNTYYSTIILFDIYNLKESLFIFVIEVAAIFFLFSYPVGILADVVGRRIVVAIGFIIQALAFLLLPLISDIYSYLLIMFPITIGLGFTFSIISGLVLIFETVPKDEFKLDFATHTVYIGVGMSLGVLLGEVVKNSITREPAYLSLILLFMIIMAIVTLTQVKETLPSRKERAWKDSLLYCLVFTQDGSLLFNYEFSANKRRYLKANPLVLVGALKAMTSLIQEMAKNEENLKIIKQEGLSILVESADKIFTAIIATDELSETRERMKMFNQEFEFVFEDILAKGIREETFYQSAEEIVKKIFRDEN